MCIIKLQTNKPIHKTCLRNCNYGVLGYQYRGWEYIYFVCEILGKYDDLVPIITEQLIKYFFFHKTKGFLRIEDKTLTQLELKSLTNQYKIYFYFSLKNTLLQSSLLTTKNDRTISARQVTSEHTYRVRNPVCRCCPMTILAKTNTISLLRRWW